jgi:hypothetical protein
MPRGPNEKSRWWVVHRPPSNRPDIWNISGHETEELALKAVRGYLSLGFQVSGVHDQTNRAVWDADAIAKKFGTPRSEKQ